AEYYDKSGNSQTVIVRCNPDVNIISLSVGKKEYNYIDSSVSRDIITEKNILCINLFFENEFIADIDSLNADYFDKDFSMGQEFIKSFCKFYTDMGEPVDSRIVMRYAGQKSLKVEVSFDYNNDELSSLTTLSLGEFFVDDKNNVYFYDYATASAYSVGKELSKYVIEK
ncbi:hypothetical protein, partial [Eubacterium sp.]|uniref:hypothetical protein n=1 Tax=Eubacterium sp. TaxID=142586 RepID=UPI003F00D6F2